MPRTYLIADAIDYRGIRDQLRTAGVRVSPWASQVGAEDILLVVTHTVQGNPPFRARHYGLETLEQILSGSPVLVPRVILLGFPHHTRFGVFDYLVRAAKRSGCYLQLPTDVASITGLIGRLAALRAEQLWCAEPGLKRSAAARVMERVCARIRHSFIDDVRPAIRVLLGAFAAGDISVEALMFCLDQCERRDSSRDLSKDIRMLRACQATYRPPFIRKKRAKADVPEGTVVVRDDRPIAAQSWSTVLQSILDGWCEKGILSRPRKVVPFSDDSFDPAGCDLILLDYELEHEPDTGKRKLGGDLLRGLRNRSMVTPVVIFTSSDEARVAKWCLANGASDFFVKELSQREERRSIEHYAILRSVLAIQLGMSEPIAVANDVHTSVRDLYQRYTSSGAAAAQVLDRQGDADWSKVVGFASDEQRSCFVDWHLRQCFRFLLADRRESEDLYAPEWLEVDSQRAISIAESLGCRPLCSSAYIHAYAAVEAVTETCRLREMARCRQRFEWPRDSGRLEQRWNARFLRPYVSDFGEPIPPRNGTAFHQHPPPPLPDLAETLSVLRFAIELTIHIHHRLGGTHVASLPLCGAPVPASAPVPAPAGSRGSHAAESELGADDFLRAAWTTLVNSAFPVSSADALTRLLEMPAPAPEAEILFIDDQVGSEGERWSEVLSATLRHRGVGVHAAHPGTPRRLGPALDGPAIRSYDAVLLDLHMPDPVDGLRVLDECKQAAPEVPVVMLTASSASGPVHRALLAGASGYFLKRRGRSADGENRFEELLELIESLRAEHFRGGRVRAAFDALSALGVSCPSSPALRPLRCAWGYLWCIEALTSQATPRMAPGRWIAQAFGVGAGSDSGDGLIAAYLIECGNAIEGVAVSVATRQGWGASTTKWMISELDRYRSNDLGSYTNTFERIWQMRVSAVHAVEDVSKLTLPDLVNYFTDLISATEWAFGS